jgi:hypothetical protein
MHGIAAIAARIAESRGSPARRSRSPLPQKRPLMNQRHHRLGMQPPRRKSRISHIRRTDLHPRMSMNHHTNRHIRGNLGILVGQMVVGRAIENLDIIAGVYGKGVNGIFDGAAAHSLNDDGIRASRRNRLCPNRQRRTPRTCKHRGRKSITHIRRQNRIHLQSNTLRRAGRLGYRNRHLHGVSINVVNIAAISGEGEGEVTIFAGLLVGIEPAAAIEVLEDAIGGIEDDEAPRGVGNSVPLSRTQTRDEKPLPVRL